MKFTRNEALRFLTELLKIDTVEGKPMPNAPFGKGNRAALDLTLSMHEKLGYRVKDADGYAGWAEKGEGSLFGILGHLDVVPADGVWSHPPFGAEIEDGVLYARGVLDDKGPMVAALAAFEELLNEGCALKRRVRFIYGCNEESGWKCMERYKQTEEMPEEGISPDGNFPVIYAEKGVAYYVLRAQKPKSILSFHAGSRPNIVPDRAEATVAYAEGIESAAAKYGIAATRNGNAIKLVSYGHAAHGSRPEDGENAAVKLLSFLGNYDKDAAVLAKKFAFSDGRNLGLSMRDEPSGALTLNLGVADTEGEELVLKIDIRHPVSAKRDTVTEILNKDKTFSVEPSAYHDPLYVDPEDPLVTELNKAYETVTGKKTSPLSIGGATYARVLKKGVAFGPAEEGEPDPIHEPDERLSLKRFDRMIDIYKEAFLKLLFR